MILALQYWEGDKAEAMRTARLIADLQPQHTREHRFMFVRRFDATEDQETVHYVSRKFDVLTHKSRRKEVGWPAGCNGVAADVMQLAGERFAAGRWHEDEPVWLLESDVLPLARDWLVRIEAEWREARAAGKLVMGAWQPEHGPFGHVNGNMIFHPSLTTRVRGLEGSAAHIGWDVYHAHRLRPVWWKSRQMINHYRATKVTESQLWPEGEPFAFVHGIKDLSGHQLVRRRLFADL